MDYSYLLSLALILLSTKVLGLFTKKLKLPQVVGALLAGLLLGPAFLGVLKETEFITNISELGVIILMFAAGLETDIKELKKTGKASFVIALIGVIVPLLGGLGVAYIFNADGDPALSSSALLQNIFIGIILTATSVSITVETLKELGKLSTKAGNAILGAALIDDILGIIALTLVTSLADPSVNIAVVLLKIVAFFAFAIFVGFLFHYAFNKWTNSNQDLRRYIIISFVFCLLLSYTAEHFFGVADITGAYIAGLVISTSSRIKYITNRFETLSYMLLSPVFFASIGLKIDSFALSGSMIAFTAIITIVAILTKIIGCGIGAKMCGFTTKESVQVGTGMISRGEVALIVANKGAAVGLMSTAYFAPIAIMVVITTIVTPILLKVVFRSKSGETAADTVDNSGIVDVYNRSAQYEQAVQNIDKESDK